MKQLKLFFALFAMLALGVTNAWAEEAKFTYSNLSGQGTSSTGGNFTGATINEIFMSGKGYCKSGNTYVQIYANNFLTFTPTNATITKIVLKATTTTYARTWGADKGTVSVDGTSITWTGSSSEIVTLTNTATAQARITNMDVTYTIGGGENPGEGGGEDPETPETGDDATMTAGTNGTACTVNGKDGIKVGTSSKGGDMKITVPAGATMLHVYAAAWKGVTGLSLKITPTSNVTTTSIALTADAGIANSTPFTLSGNEADYLFDIPLQNITTETTLTFTSSAAKRFVVWGATYETAGGDEPGSGETVVSLIPKNGCLLGGKFT